ncbi:hypothetical protein [Poseidonibacter lekithochrous]|nr:hypothetical protein [Poseidonibacter lekithochrous]QKJ23580.1 hypothetical protein ALEK_2324 [Poseidonibacter lekithochrous]
MIKYFTYAIIAGFILSFSGCGFKGDPIYVEDKQIEVKKTGEVSE